jgi:hypothetical protein
MKQLAFYGSIDFNGKTKGGRENVFDLQVMVVVHS